MALIRWEPIAELNTIQNEMNQLFSTLSDPLTASGRGGGSGRRWLPAMDLIETGEHYLLRADLPGLSANDVTIQVQDNVLTLSGERRAERHGQHEGYHWLERAFGSFSRSLTLPEGVDADAVQAHFDHGVLEVVIPKPAQSKPRQVQITPGTRATAQRTAIGGANSGQVADPQTHTNEPVPAHA